jgi:hypothetical protein
MSTDVETKLTGTRFPEIFAALAAPFEASELKQRKGAGGRMLDYVTARSVCNRLDEVVGPESWSDDYIETKTGLMCRLTITMPDGAKVTKADGGAAAAMDNADDTEKSAFTHSFKRAAAKWGIARYLYRDGVPDFAEGAHPANGHPAPARSSGYDQPRPSVPPAPAHGNAPRTGRGLFAWCKEQQEQHDVDLIGYLGKWCKLHDLPDRLVMLNDDDVPTVHAEAVRKLQGVGGQGRPDADDGAIDRQKRELWRLICKIAGTDKPTGELVGGVLEEIAHETGGEVIASIKECRDGRLLGASIVAAETLLGRDAAV